ncbi:MAG: glycoside hydrolase family 71/99-like protein [Fimbriimonas sp.]
MISLLAAIALSPRPLVLAHYMPWYSAPPVSKEWGWHWTMNHFDPSKKIDGKRQIASKYYPLIGPYDSNDPDVLECQALLMKFAGLDGAIIDWYGYEDVYDYKLNHRNTVHFIEYLKKANLKFAICFEDQTLPNLIKFGKVKEENAALYGRSLLKWMDKNWFASPSYVKLNGKPVMLVFGPQYYKAPQWKELTAGIDIDVFGVMGDHGFATGGFAWPNPRGGTERADAEFESFYKRSPAWKAFIAGAYPRFNDIYAEAKVHDSWGRVEDRAGRTLIGTLRQALASKAPLIQVATWNDWGEGTMIEPSVENGYRDLEILQSLRRGNMAYSAADLRLPVRLLRLRKSGASRTRLDKAAELLFQGKTAPAKELL